MRLDRSVEADADLPDILSFGVGRWGHRTGSEYFFSFDERFARLADRPHVGVKMTRLGPHVRSVRHRQHRIYYEVNDERVLILRVLHVACDVDRAFRGTN